VSQSVSHNLTSPNLKFPPNVWTPLNEWGAYY